MSLENSDNLFVNIDEIDNNPEEAAKLRHLMALQSYRKNIIKVSEFRSKYESLFIKDANANVQELRELANEYMLRIDPYNPVYIVYSLDYPTIKELLQDQNVVVVLPAIYNRLGTVNNLKEVGLDKMLAFNNLAAMDISDPFDRKKARYSQDLAAIFNAMTDPAELERNKERAQAMAKTALEKVHRDPESAPEQHVSEDEIIQQYEEDSADTPTVTEEFL